MVRELAVQISRSCPPSKLIISSHLPTYRAQGSSPRNTVSKLFFMMKGKKPAALLALLQTCRPTSAFRSSSLPTRRNHMLPRASKIAPPPTTPLCLPSLLLSRRQFSSPSLSVVMTSMSSSSCLDETNDPFIPGSFMASSLASEYAIRIHPIVCTSSENDPTNSMYRLSWDFHPLQNWDASANTSQALELRALNDCAQKPSPPNSALSNTVSASTVTCTWEGPYGSDWYIEIHAVEGHDIPRELVCVMSRIMVQSAASHIASLNQQAHKSTLLHLTLPIPGGESFEEFQLSQLLPPTKECDNNDVAIRKLFTPLNADYAGMEIVDMVNQHGHILGSLPRPFVHSWNILHRGIGMIVTKDTSILDSANQGGRRPEIYVHQRTATKRIFPSLYDMFVGGVSSRGESAELTAAREIAEELGLTGALDFQQSADDGMFNPSRKSCFNALSALPIIVISGEGLWPGGAGEDGRDPSLTRDQIEVMIQKLKHEYSNHLTWESWDFVPDGLLVWEAWLRWFNKKTL
ncbi:hypothetical protein HJC23_006728 [Cyclotella cryptica]|uniref:Nudix hydrolase domain-containing protein n=1 Tax=Cyclotella cryptica TaxID=29204 RepID=A0ABD3PU87_9STRA